MQAVIVGGQTMQQEYHTTLKMLSFAKHQNLWIP
jgi:hypothetical protein